MDQVEQLDTVISIALERRCLLRLAGLGLLGAAATPVLLGCTPANAAGIVIEMTSAHGFAPVGVTVPRGATVVWKNVGQVPHTSTCDPARVQNRLHVGLPPGARPWDSGDIAPGQTWTNTLETAGLYLYVCRYHAQEGMLGTITVTA